MKTTRQLMRHLIVLTTFVILIFSFSDGRADTQCPPGDVGCIMRVGGAMVSIDNQGGTWATIFEIQVVSLYQQLNPDASNDDLVNFRAFIRSELQKHKGNFSYNTVIAILNDIPAYLISQNVQAARQIAAQITAEIDRTINSFIVQSDNTISNYQQSYAQWSSKYSEYANKVLEDIDNYCKVNSATCENINALYEPLLNVALGKTSPGEVITNLPVIKNDPILSSVAAAIDPVTGNWILNQAQTEALIIDTLSNLGVMNTRNIDWMRQFDLNQNTIMDTIDYVNDTLQTGIQVYDMAQALANIESDMPVLQRMQTTVDIGSKILGTVFNAPDLANTVSTYGNAAITIASAISQLSSLSAGIGNVEIGSGENGGGGGGGVISAATGLATAYATGNVIGGVMSAYSLFSSLSGPGPDQSVTMGIQALQASIANLQVNMNRRFDRIDKSLNVIMTELNTISSKLSDINTNLVLIRSTVVQTQHDLSLLQLRVSQMERNIIDALVRQAQATQIASFNNTVNGYIGFSQSLSYSDYSIFGNAVFYTWAAMTSANASFAPMTMPVSIDDGTLYNASWLSPSDLSTNINTFAQYLKARWPDLPSLMPGDGSPIPNPITWAEGAEAYLQLSKGKPWYAALSDIANSNNQPPTSPQHSIFSIINQGMKIRNLTSALSNNKNIISKMLQLPGSSIPGLYEEKAQQLFAAINKIWLENTTDLSIPANQIALYRKIVALHDTTVPGYNPATDPFNQLDGAKRLIQAYLYLGFDRSLKGNDYLRYLVNGWQEINVLGSVVSIKGIMGGSDIVVAYLAAIQKLTDTNSAQPILDFQPLLEKRRTALAGQLATIISAIESGTFAEFQSASDPTIDKLQMRASTLLSLASNDNFTTPAGQPLSVETPGVAAQGILANDTKQGDVAITVFVPAGTPLNADGSFTIATAKNGTATLKSNGSFVYQPAIGFTGIDSFTYKSQAINASLLNPIISDPATVFIQVSGTPPSVVGLRPTSFSAATNSYTSPLLATYRDTNGAGTIASAQIRLSSPATGSTNGMEIVAEYNISSGKIVLYDSIGTGSFNCTPGATAILTNVYGSIDCSRTVVSTSGTDLNISWAVIPATTTPVAATIYLKADDNAANSSGPVNMGTWTVVSSPAPPVNVSAYPGNSQIMVSFDSSSSGGNPVTGYTVTATPGNLIVNGSSSPITVPGLANGTLYSISVTASNAVGESSPTAIYSVTPLANAIPPNPPTVVNAVAGKGEATIFFTPPAFNGGIPVTGYKATSLPGNISASGATSPITVSNLMYGIPFTFTVAPFNSNGSGPPSATSNSITLVATPGDIITVAGNGTSGYSGDGGLANQASIFANGVTVDGNGNIYIVGDQRIRKVDAVSGIITTVAGNGTAGYAGDEGLATNASLNFPSDVAVDNTGNIYIADNNNHRIRRVDAVSRIISTFAGNGNIYVSTTPPTPYNDNGPAKSAFVVNPSAIAFDSTGNLYISESGHIRKVVNGNISTVPGISVYASDIAFDSSGDLIVSDLTNDLVQKLAFSTGVVTTMAGGGTQGYTDNSPATSVSLYNPTGVAVDAANNLYISDFLSCAVRKVAAATGIITTVTGNGPNGACIYDGDNGPAPEASIYSPSAVALDSGGNLYIATGGIRKVIANSTPTGNVPGAPTNVIATAGFGQALVSFTPPAIIGSSPITKYTVISNNGISATGSTGPIIVPGLSNGVSYTFTVTASNAVGTGPASVASSSVVPGQALIANLGNLVSTVVGNGTPGFTGDLGPAILAQINNPTGIAFNGFGDLYFIDTGNNRIRMVDSVTGVISTVAGNGTVGFAGDTGLAINAALANPKGIAVADNLDLYICDTGNNRVRKVDAVTQIISTVAGNEGSYNSLATISGLATSFAIFCDDVAIDTFRNLFINTGNKIVMVDTSSGLIYPAAGAPPIVFMYPPQSDGQLATAGYMNYIPKNVALDSFGNFYYSQNGSAVEGNFIRKVDRLTSILSTVAGSGLSSYSGDGGPATLAGIHPSNLVFDSSNNLFISDDMRIRMVSSSGIISTIAGDGTTIFKNDGVKSTATGMQPSGLAIYRTNNLYYSDTINNRIRKITFLPPVPNTTTTITSSTNSSAPGQPVALTATVSNYYAIPDGYVHFKDGAQVIGSAFLVNGTATITINTLALGNHSLSAEYAVHSNNFSSSSSAVLPHTVAIAAPAAPGRVVATAGNAQATVSITVPLTDNGGVITGYTVTSLPAGGIDLDAGTTILSHRISGLVNGSSYSFTVTAINAIGTSPPSAPSNSIIPATVPGAPTAVSATPGNGSAIVSFSAPVSNGGIPITGYTVTSSPGNVVAVASTAAPVTISGLSNGTTYTFRVSATNAAGTGPASATSNPVVPPDVVPYSLNLAFAGTGGGSVNSTPPGINCTSGNVCPPAYFNPGITVSLLETPANGSGFSGWGNTCIGTGACSVLMTQDSLVSAAFNMLPNVMLVGNPQLYGLLQQAYAASISASMTSPVLKALGITFVENLDFSANINATIKGGYNPGFITLGGSTAIQGTLTIRRGQLTIDGLVIK